MGNGKGLGLIHVEHGEQPMPHVHAAACGLRAEFIVMGEIGDRLGEAIEPGTRYIVRFSLCGTTARMTSAGRRCA
jgi:hypothetical protein